MTTGSMRAGGGNKSLLSRWRHRRQKLRFFIMDGTDPVNFLMYYTKSDIQLNKGEKSEKRGSIRYHCPHIKSMIPAYHFIHLLYRLICRARMYYGVLWQSSNSIISHTDCQNKKLLSCSNLCPSPPVFVRFSNVHSSICLPFTVRMFFEMPNGLPPLPKYHSRTTHSTKRSLIRLQWKLSHLAFSSPF